MSLPEWKTAWRKGIAPLLEREQLAALQQALASDDPRLIQGNTVLPPPLDPCALVRGACALAWCAWQGPALRGDAAVCLVDQAFHRLCVSASELCGGPAGLSIFLNWFDETPRHQMRAELLAEVELALAAKEVPA